MKLLSKYNLERMLVFGLIAALILTWFADGFVTYATLDKAEIEVFNKERVCTSTDCKYLIYTNNLTKNKKEVFEDTDNMWLLKENSTDLYGDIEVGQIYIAKITGYKNHFFSWYRNIVSIIESK